VFPGGAWEQVLKSETFIATEETEPLGRCIPRGAWAKAITSKVGKDVCSNVHNYTISGSFLQENLFRIFLSPCGIVVYGAK
jgi:hypothetical protein